MGDVAIAVPVVKAFLQQNADIEATLLSRSSFFPLFSDVENLQFYEADLQLKHKKFLGLLRLFNELRRFSNFDYIIDLHSVLRSKILSFLFATAGSKVFTINKGRKQKKLLTQPQNKVLQQLTPSYMRYAEVFKKAGFNIEMENTERLISNFRTQSPYLPENKDNLPKIGIAPFARHRGKQYPIEMMEKVIHLLSLQLNIFIFGGGNHEKQIAEKWEEKYANVASTIGKLSLQQELAFIKTLRLMLAMDSANMHIAAIAGVPTISVWGATHPFAGFVPFGQHNELNYIQLNTQDMPCRPCSVFGISPCLRTDYACLTTIKPETIAKRILDKISND